MKPLRLAPVAILILTLIVAGCGDIPRSKVHGKVTLHGKSLGDATVIFLTQDKMTHLVGLKSDGSYEIDGIPRGPVSVSIQQALPHVPPRADPTKSRAKAATAGVGEAKDADLDRNPPPSEEKPISNPLPPIYNDPQKSGLKFDLTEAVQEWSVDLK